VKAELLFELYSIACLLAVIWMSLCQLRQGNSLVSQVMQQVRGSTETPVPLKEVCQLLLFGTIGIPISSMLPWQKYI